MAEIAQLSFFDAETAQDYQRQQRDAELEALMWKHIGAKATRQWQAREAKLKAELDAILTKPLAPEMPAARERIFARVQAKTKPLSNDYTF
jgi:hypothetical protein